MFTNLWRLTIAENIKILSLSAFEISVPMCKSTDVLNSEMVYRVLLKVIFFFFCRIDLSLHYRERRASVNKIYFLLKKSYFDDHIHMIFACKLLLPLALLKKDRSNSANQNIGPCSRPQ